MKIGAIICDIEGTTTSISFVKDVLFNYAYKNCKKYLIDNYDDVEIRTIINDLVKYSQDENKPLELKNDRAEDIVIVTQYVQELIKKDLKWKPLKELQGKIWRLAYESHAIQGHVYDDVLRNFQKWTAKGIKIFIYSSGSVEAQKLLFKYSMNGDLTKYLSGYFDTNIGFKIEAKSYRNILQQIGYKAENVLFLSDILNEVLAAKQAGINCHILLRPNNYPLIGDQKNSFKLVNDFDEIDV